MTIYASTQAAVEAVIGVGRCLRAGEVPEGQTLPYVVVNEDISSTTALAGDGRTERWARLVQFSLFEYADAYVPTLRADLIDALNGRRDPGHLRTMRVIDWQQLADVETEGRKTQQTAITVRVATGSRT